MLNEVWSHASCCQRRPSRTTLIIRIAKRFVRVWLRCVTIAQTFINTDRQELHARCFVCILDVIKSFKTGGNFFNNKTKFGRVHALTEPGGVQFQANRNECTYLLVLVFFLNIICTKECLPKQNYNHPTQYTIIFN